MIEEPPCGTEWHLTGWAKALAAVPIPKPIPTKTGDFIFIFAYLYITCTSANQTLNYWAHEYVSTTLNSKLLDRTSSCFKITSFGNFDRNGLGMLTEFGRKTRSTHIRSRSLLKALDHISKTLNSNVLNFNFIKKKLMFVKIAIYGYFSPMRNRKLFESGLNYHLFKGIFHLSL